MLSVRLERELFLSLRHQVDILDADMPRRAMQHDHIVIRPFAIDLNQQRHVRPLAEHCRQFFLKHIRDKQPLVARLIFQFNFALLIHRQHHFIVYLFHRCRRIHIWRSHFRRELQRGDRDDEDDEQHERQVHQGRDVNRPDGL